MVDLRSYPVVSSFPIILGVANGLSKNKGLAKFWLIFKCLAVSFLVSLLVSESRFFGTTVSESRIFDKTDSEPRIFAQAVSVYKSFLGSSLRVLNFYKVKK